MDYKERKFTIGSRKLTFRGAGWQGCLNILPYLVIRKNPIRTDWRCFSIEFGWLMWAAGFCYTKY